MIEILIYALVGLMTVIIPIIYFLHERKKNRRAAEILQKSLERGQDEPVSLHPYIDPDKCIGAGACVAACPEQNVLGLINNRGVLIKPSNCIGHGLCQAACPVDAITLVFGSEKRGVEIPHINGTFETNVPGIYIAGELGGMGLIRNAIAQGRQAVENISKSLKASRENIYDLVIVGCGPAGISASLQAKKDGLKFITLDQEDLGGTILSYPRKKLVMTQPVELPIYGKLNYREIKKEELLELFSEVFRQTGLTVISGAKVNEIVKENGHFKIISSKGEYISQKILLAIGRRGSPRKLDVPGEKSGKVSYRLLDPEKFYKMNILVVGGGDSAIEAAVALSEQKGNKVYLSYRKEAFFRIKEGNAQRIEEAIENKKVIPFFNSQVKQIEKDKVVIEQSGQEISIDNDYVFVFIGGELPAELLNKAGIVFTRKFGEK